MFSSQIKHRFVLRVMSYTRWDQGRWIKWNKKRVFWLMPCCCFSPTAKIHYQPALPSQREFLTQNMPVGHMIKFIITYQTVSNRRYITIKHVIWVMLWWYLNNQIFNKKNNKNLCPPNSCCSSSGLSVNNVLAIYIDKSLLRLSSWSLNWLYVQGVYIWSCPKTAFGWFPDSMQLIKKQNNI